MNYFQYKRIFLSVAFFSLVFLPIQPSEKRREGSRYYNEPESSITLKEIALGATGIAVGAAGCYFIARLCGAGLYSAVLHRYAPELDALLRDSFKEGVLEEELIPHVLEQHDRNNSLYFFIQSKYKNYPLLYYKNNLDWYINRLWLSKFLHYDAQARHKIDVLVQKLERIRRLVVTDYRFVKEQRDFDQQNRTINKNKNK